MGLPEIYKNKLSNEIRNSQTTYYGKLERNNYDDILANLPVTTYIETKTGKMEAIIIAKTDNYIITSKNKVINFKDIISLKKA